jgi:hypothetical protein
MKHLLVLLALAGSLEAAAPSLTPAEKMDADIKAALALATATYTTPYVGNMTCSCGCIDTGKCVCQNCNSPVSTEVAFHHKRKEAAYAPLVITIPGEQQAACLAAGWRYATAAECANCGLGVPASVSASMAPVYWSDYPSVSAWGASSYFASPMSGGCAGGSCGTSSRGFFRRR